MEISWFVHLCEHYALWGIFGRLNPLLMRPMVDLRTQYLHIRDEVERNMAEVIENTAFINGPQVKAFALELGAYLDGTEVIPCA
ncbi:MAG: hypothetical protein FJ336_08175, partial [Sphingomonadales bacterium]|nr:hypothetical protein [Sphingomonadales bacterium]